MVTVSYWIGFRMGRRGKAGKNIGRAVEQLLIESGIESVGIPGIGVIRRTFKGNILLDIHEGVESD